MLLVTGRHDTAFFEKVNRIYPASLPDKVSISLSLPTLLSFPIRPRFSTIRCSRAQFEACPLLLRLARAYHARGTSLSLASQLVGPVEFSLCSYSLSGNIAIRTY